MPAKKKKSEIMLYPQVTTEAWAAQYNLTLTPRDCVNCGIPQYPTIPFATGNWRGLMAPLHDCGERYRLTRARDVDPKENEKWAQVYQELKKQCENEPSVDPDDLH
jgi:hypothetical protein